MTARRIVIMSMFRLESKRLKNKNLLPIGSKPLALRVLEQSCKAAKCSGIPVYAAICPEDVPLVRIAEQAGVKILPRSHRSIEGETLAEIYDPPLMGAFRRLADWIVFQQGPFTDPEEICRFVALAQTAVFPMWAVFERRGFLWDGASRRIDRSIGQGSDTKNNAVYYVPSHTLSCAPTSGPYRLGTLGNYNSIRPIPIPDTLENRCDVDTPEDYALACHLAEQERLADMNLRAGP